MWQSSYAWLYDWIVNYCHVCWKQKVRTVLGTCAAGGSSSSALLALDVLLQRWDGIDDYFANIKTFFMVRVPELKLRRHCLKSAAKMTAVFESGILEKEQYWWLDSRSLGFSYLAATLIKSFAWWPEIVTVIFLRTGYSIIEQKLHSPWRMQFTGLFAGSGY